MDTDSVYVCEVYDNADGPESIEEFKEYYESEHPEATTESLDFNGEPAFSILYEDDEFTAMNYSAIYNNKLYLIAHYFNPDYTDANESSVLNSISFGEKNVSSSEDKRLMEYDVEGLTISLNDDWTCKDIDSDGDYSFADQSESEFGEELLAQKAFEYPKAEGAVLVYCFDCSDTEVKSIEDVKANLLGAGTDENNTSYIEVDGVKALKTVTSATVEEYDWNYLNVYMIIENKLFEIYSPYTKDDISMEKPFEEFIESITVH